MKTKLCDVNAAAMEKLPQFTDDKSGVGVHYVDAYIKPMNTKLPDGTPVKCKRRGIKIALSAGGKKGDGLLRKLDVSRDPAVMLDAALQEAAKAAGIELAVEDGAIFLNLEPAGQTA
jgi:hypothetical protein